MQEKMNRKEGEANTHGSFGLGGTRALPRKTRLICLMDVGSARFSTTLPVNKVGSTSTPVPLRYSWSDATAISKQVCGFSLSLSLTKEAAEVLTISWSALGLEDATGALLEDAEDGEDCERKAAWRAETRRSSVASGKAGRGGLGFGFKFKFGF